MQLSRGLLDFARQLRPLEPIRTRRLWSYFNWLQANDMKAFKAYCKKLKEVKK